MTSRLPGRSIRPGIERLPEHIHASRHQHRDPYVTVVLSGAYVQAGYAGRLSVGAGDLVLQPSFDCHTDHMLSRGVELLRLPWTRELGLGGVFADCPIDDIRRAAGQSIVDATLLVSEVLATRSIRVRRLDASCDHLAADLAADTSLSIGEWAVRHGRSRESLAREFRAGFGVSASRYRLELRARAAWSAIVGSVLSLSIVAQDTRFADQAHMTRAVGWLTGAPPSRWRPAPCVTAPIGADEFPIPT